MQMGYLGFILHCLKPLRLRTRRPRKAFQWKPLLPSSLRIPASHILGVSLSPGCRARRWLTEQKYDSSVFGNPKPSNNCSHLCRGKQTLHFHNSGHMSSKSHFLFHTILFHLNLWQQSLPSPHYPAEPNAKCCLHYYISTFWVEEKRQIS